MRRVREQGFMEDLPHQTGPQSLRLTADRSNEPIVLRLYIICLTSPLALNELTVFLASERDLNLQRVISFLQYCLRTIILLWLLN